MVAVMGISCFVSSCKINHFGINPVRGGRPPNDNNTRAAVVTIVGVLDQDRARVLIFVVEVNLNVRKAAVVMITYVPRVRAVSCGENCRIMIIQPRCAMEE